MSHHHATISWTRTTDSFKYEDYDRGHNWAFPGGVQVPGSAAPDYRGDSSRVNPEEAFIAALSSCHMLTFLAIASRKRLVVDSYTDAAEGVLEKGPDGREWVTRVTLRPRITFAPGTNVDETTLKDLHHRSHELCFIANSVKTEVTVEG